MGKKKQVARVLVFSLIVLAILLLIAASAAHRPELREQLIVSSLVTVALCLLIKHYEQASVSSTALPEWKSILESLPRQHQLALLYRAGDISPVVGERVWRNNWNCDWYLWDAGSFLRESSKELQIIGGGEDWLPTHWMPIEDLDLPF